MGAHLLDGWLPRGRRGALRVLLWRGGGAAIESAAAGDGGCTGKLWISSTVTLSLVWRRPLLPQVHWVHFPMLAVSQDASELCPGSGGVGGAVAERAVGGRSAQASLWISSHVPLSLLWGRPLLHQIHWVHISLLSSSLEVGSVRPRGSGRGRGWTATRRVAAGCGGCPGKTLNFFPCSPQPSLRAPSATPGSLGALPCGCLLQG